MSYDYGVDRDARTRKAWPAAAHQGYVEQLCAENRRPVPRWLWVTALIINAFLVGAFLGNALCDWGLG